MRRLRPARRRSGDQLPDEDFAVRIAELTEGRGVDVIIDIVGAPYFERNLKSLALDGRLVEVATQYGTTVERFDLFHLMRRRLTVTGSTMRPRTTAEKGAIADDLRTKVWPLLEAGRVAPVIHQVFPLEQAAEAHRVMESSVHIGKLCCTSRTDERRSRRMHAAPDRAVSDAATSMHCRQRPRPRR